MRTAPTDRPGSWTIEEYLLLGETTTPCELINGNVVMSPSPNPNHQKIVVKLLALFTTEVDRLGGHVFPSLDVFLNEQNVFQPDLLVVLKENIHLITSRGVAGAPDLVIEVLSPSNKYYDRDVKLTSYLEAGVCEYWIIEPEEKTLEIFTPSNGTKKPAAILQGDERVTSSVLPNLSFKLSKTFKNLLPV